MPLIIYECRGCAALMLWPVQSIPVFRHDAMGEVSEDDPETYCGHCLRHGVIKVILRPDPEKSGIYAEWLREEIRSN